RHRRAGPCDPHAALPGLPHPGHRPGAEGAGRAAARGGLDGDRGRPGRRPLRARPAPLRGPDRDHPRRIAPKPGAPCHHGGMNGFEDATWLVPCAGLSAIGFIGAWVLWRRRGARAGLRLAALALLPLAAWLSGSVRLFWDLGTAVGRWAGGLVLSPRVWAGVALAGLAVVLFLVAGLLRRRAP